MAFEYNQGGTPSQEDLLNRQKTIAQLEQMLKSSDKEEEEDPEEVYDDEENEDEDNESEDSENEDSDDDDEDPEIKAEQEMAKKADKEALFNRLKKIYDKPRIIPSLSIPEKLTVALGKKKFPAMVAKINLKIATLKANQRISRSLLASGGSTLAIPIAVVICVMIIFALLFAALNDPQSGTDGVETGTPASLLYGVRAVYEDKDESRVYLAKSYGEIVSYTIKQVNSSTSDYQINITLPTEENFNYADLISNYQDSSYTYYDYAQLTYQFANAVYQNDVSLGLTSAEVTDFASTLDAIVYFGTDAAIEELVTQNLSNYILTNNLITNKDGNETNLQNQIKAVINNYLTNNNVRTQKLFILDIPVVEGKNAPSLYTKRNYKAYIYLNKQAVKVEYLSYSTTGKIKLRVFANNNPIEISGAQEADAESDTWMYETASNLNINVEAIGENYVQNDPLLKDGKSASLLQLAQSENASKYLTIDNNIYTYSTYGLCVQMEADTNFSFSEFATTIS